MTWEKFFSGAIRVVFLFAFGAFLWASIHHVATFFHNFEPDNSDWTGSYALAISVDGTALMLTVGMMFFGRTMPWYAKFIVWFFIFSLTAFSWVVNWEYAVRYQSADLTTDTTLKLINPILASSFAFLNLAYAVVSEFFNTRVKTVEELQAELDALTGTRATLEKQIKEAKGPGLIQLAKTKTMEVKSAFKEVVSSDEIADRNTANESDIPQSNNIHLVKNEEPYEDDMEDTAIPETPYIQSNQPDMEPISSTSQQSFSDDMAPHLGMIEQMMYDRIVSNPSELSTLIEQVKMFGIAQVTQQLKARFSGYASYITEDRIRTIWRVIQFEQMASKSTQDNSDMGPSTDPNQIAINLTNGADIQANVPTSQQDTSADMGVISSPNHRQGKTDIPDDMDNISSLNGTPKSNDTSGQTASNLEQNTDSYQNNMAASNGANTTARKGPYAITKEAAAEIKSCQVRDIEAGISAGILKTFAKDQDKILVSSLTDWSPPKKRKSRETSRNASKSRTTVKLSEYELLEV